MADTKSNTPAADAALAKLRESFTTDNLVACQKAPPAERTSVSKDGIEARIHPDGRITFHHKAAIERANGIIERPLVGLGTFHATQKAGFCTLKNAKDRVADLKAATDATWDAVRASVEELSVVGERALPKSRREVVTAGGKTVREVAALWLESLRRPVKEGGRQHVEPCEATLRADILPAIGDVPFRDVLPVHCAGIVRGVVKRGAKVHAGTVLQHLNLLCDFAVATGEIPMSPSAGLKPRALGVQQGVSTRALTVEEIPLVWHGLDYRAKTQGKLRRGQKRNQKGMDEMTKTVLRFLMLLPCRCGELLLAEKSEVNWDAEGGPVWTIPIAHQKKNPRSTIKPRKFRQPLSPLAAQLMRRMFALAPDSRYIVASDGEAGHMDHHTLDHAMARLFAPTAARKAKVYGRLKKKIPARPAMPPVIALPGDPDDEECGQNAPTPHDFRHTFGTRVKQACGYSIEFTMLVEACLNHSKGFVGRYQHDDAFEERKEMLFRWSAFVAGLVGEVPSKDVDAEPAVVVPLHRNAA